VKAGHHGRYSAELHSEDIRRMLKMVALALLVAVLATALAFGIGPRILSGVVLDDRHEVVKDL
jgi:hypothetical protein